MPTNFRCQIVKSIGSEQWSNDYLMLEETIEDAQDVANELITFERTIHMTTVLFEYVRISTTLEGDRFFRHIALNLAGQRDPVDRLPLYCTFRLDMPTADSDPCRKYYRGPVGESDQVNGVLVAGTLAEFAIKVTNGLVTPGVLAHIYTPRGNVVVGASFNPNVQMRQLSRRRRRVVPTP